MTIQKVKAIILSNKDYSEKDKQVVLFSVEKGKIFCTLKGVKNQNAKLKIAKEIFCFGDFLYVDGGNNIITSCEVIENFFDITKDIDKYFEGCMLLEVTNTILLPNQPNPHLFVELIKALKAINFENAPMYYSVTKYLISIFESLGYKLNLNKCACCGGEFYDKRFLLLNSGEIVCFGCKSNESINISPKVHSALRILAQTDYNKLCSLKLGGESAKEALEVLIENFKHRFNKSLKIF